MGTMSMGSGSSSLSLACRSRSKLRRMRTKTRPAQLDREIAEVLARARRSQGPQRHHAAIASEVRTAAPHVDAIYHALYQSKDPDALIAAVRAAQKHAAAMKRVTKGRGGHVDSRGEFDAKMYELANLLVAAKQRVKNIKTSRRTGRYPKATSRTAWRTRGI